MDTSEEPSPEPSRQQQAGSGIAAAAENETHASQFSWVEVRQYVDVTKPHAKNPGGLARKLYRTGEEDEDIKHFFLLRAAAKGKQQKQSYSFSEFDFNTYIEELITNNDVAQLERERDGIEQREGPKLDWERRVFDFFSQTAADHDEAA